MNKFAGGFAKTANIWIGLLAAFLALTLVAFFMTQFAFANKRTINAFLGLASSKSVETGTAEVAYHYKSDYMETVGKPTQEEFDRLKADSKEQAISEMEEGAILLRNNDVDGVPALPLKSDEMSVSLFGHGSVDPLYKPPSGGAQYSGNPQVDVKTALEGAGFDVNDDLYDAYARARDTGEYGGGWRNDNMTYGGWEIYEVEKSFYDQEGIRSSYTNYKDAAIVFITRTAGENRDCPTGRSGRDADWYTREDPSQDYLELFPNERDMLEEVRSAGFDKTILVLNTSNMLQAEWLDEYEIDACIYTAGYGHYGTIGLANILCGDVNPSGRLVDTWAYDFMSSPAMTNFGYFTYTNASEKLTAENKVTEALEKTAHYVVYAEGIYIGYKYYETRYEDVILGRGGADSDVGSSTGGSWNYSEEVQFPFGYGLSYTTFSLEMLSGNYNEDNVGSEFTFDVKVTNTGDVPGKRSVQLYFQAPYDEYGVEKSAIQLVDFEKTTKELQPGESETLTFTVDKYLLASYDEDVAKGYILDPGDYYFAVGDSAHDALNHILKAKGMSGMVNHDGTAYAPDSLNKVWKWDEQTELDTETYRYSAASGGTVEVTNRLDDMDINYWLPGTVTYLTRSDWAGTYPTEYTEITLTDEMAQEISGNYYEEIIPDDAPSVGDFTQGAENGISFVSMHGVAYDDPIWEDFIDQLTVEEMLSVIWEHWSSPMVESVNKPANSNDDGPDGINQGFKMYDEDGNRLPHINGECTMFPNEVILASTFSKYLIEKRGSFLGEQSMFANCTQLWSPGADLHRTPYGGRNFEYYSEDSYMSYICAGIEVGAMREKGVVTAIKHCCGNNQETRRQGLSTFSNEQAFRMNDMRGFEGAFTIGKSNGTMTSFNRIGMRAFSQSNVMQQEVLRGEWGFKGVIISDAVDIYMHSRESLAAGNDMWCLAGNESRVAEVKEAIENGDGFMLQNLRRANKNFYYAYCNSNLTNGLSATTKIVPVVNWWEIALETVEIVLLVLTVIFAGLFIGSTVTRIVIARKEKKNA